MLEQINLSIQENDFISVIGPNGGGKTTLLKLILGIITPDQGQILVNGMPPKKASFALGYVPQNVHINTHFPITALDVVLMGTLNLKSKKPIEQHKAAALSTLNRLETEDIAHKRIGELSGGQRQRVFIARALMTQPQLLLLDEPTASVDSKGQTAFFQLLKELNKHVAILVVSHDLFVISNYIKSIACVNKRLHYHPHEELTGDMLEHMVSCSVEDVCRAQVMTRGLPRMSEIDPKRKTNGDS